MIGAPASTLRRRLLLAGACGLGTGGATASNESPTGWVKPRPMAPAITLTDSQGRRSTLADKLRGRLTAVQLMFTGCSTTCPPQGLLFAQMAARHQQKAVGWLSISIDTLGDDAQRLAAWQHKLGAHPAWQAAVPSPREVDALADFVRGAPARSGTHTTQVFFFDADARLAYRTADWPSVALLDELLSVVR